MARWPAPERARPHARALQRGGARTADAGMSITSQSHACGRCTTHSAPGREERLKREGATSRAQCNRSPGPESTHVRVGAGHPFDAGRNATSHDGTRSRPGGSARIVGAICFSLSGKEAKAMNTMTARALMVGLVIALWAWVASVARLHVSMWAGVVALGCFFAAGGGVPGLQKTVVTTLAGVLWVLVSHAVRVAIGGGGVVAAVILGATACALVLQSRVPFLSFTAGAFAGAGVALGLGVNTVIEAIRAGVALAVGALLGFAAERAAGMVRTRGG